MSRLNNQRSASMPIAVYDIVHVFCQARLRDNLGSGAGGCAPSQAAKRGPQATEEMPNDQIRVSPAPAAGCFVPVGRALVG